jgi:hypothetical protein
MCIFVYIPCCSFEVTNTEDAGLKHPFMVPIIPKTGHFMRVYDRK